MAAAARVEVLTAKVGMAEVAAVAEGTEAVVMEAVRMVEVE